MAQLARQKNFKILLPVFGSRSTRTVHRRSRDVRPQMDLAVLEVCQGQDGEGKVEPGCHSNKNSVLGSISCQEEGATSWLRKHPSRHGELQEGRLLWSEILAFENSRKSGLLATRFNRLQRPRNAEEVLLIRNRFWRTFTRLYDSWFPSTEAAATRQASGSFRLLGRKP